MYMYMYIYIYIYIYMYIHIINSIRVINNIIAIIYIYIYSLVSLVLVRPVFGVVFAERGSPSAGSPVRRAAKVGLPCGRPQRFWPAMAEGLRGASATNGAGTPDPNPRHLVNLCF